MRAHDTPARDGPADVSLHFLATTADEARVAGAARLLDADERARAERFHQPADRLRFLLTRAALRQLIGTALGLAPTAVRLRYGAAGKPLLEGNDALHFNVSHSGAFAAIALSRRAPVGIDIEQPRADLDCLAIARAHFAAHEHAALAAVSEGPRRAAFYRLWTFKEAVTKAHGTGITDGLPPIPTALWLPPAAPPARVGDTRLWGLAAPHGHVAALALKIADEEA